MIKVMVADDHAILRVGIEQCISSTSDIKIIDEAVDGEDALDKVLRNDYDVVLLDITMPGRNGLDILKQMKAQKPEQKVLVFTIHPEEQYGVLVLAFYSVVLLHERG